jgi:hypothetical protein
MIEKLEGFMSDIKNIQELININYRRLQKLKEQRAFQGAYSVDPKITIDIEEIETEIIGLQTQLGTLETEAQLPFEKNTSNDSDKVSSNTKNLIPGQRNRLLRKLETLQQPRDLINEKIKRLKTALVVETSEAVKFQLEQQLLEAEAKLANFDSEIDEIERALQQ